MLKNRFGKQLAGAVGAALGFTLAVSACSGGGEIAYETGAITTQATGGRPIAVVESQAFDMVAEDSLMLSVGAPGAVPMADVAVESDREIILTGFAWLRSDDPIAAAQSLANYASSVGGSVDSRRENRATEQQPARAFLELRIPAAQMTGFVSGLAAFGEVAEVTMDQVDVTARGADLDARIAALDTSINRLTELMLTAGELGDLLQVEQELTRRQAELDGLRASRATLTDQVTMSSLRVEITATDTAIEELEPSHGFLDAVVAGWNALRAFGRGLGLALGAVLPWLIAIGILWALLVPVVRWLRRKLAERRTSGGGRGPRGFRGPVTRRVISDDGDVISYGD